MCSGRRIYTVVERELNTHDHLRATHLIGKPLYRVSGSVRLMQRLHRSRISHNGRYHESAEGCPSSIRSPGEEE